MVKIAYCQKKIEQKIKDESKFDQNNDPIVKEALYG